jgi:hypothetical protein
MPHASNIPPDGDRASVLAATLQRLADASDQGSKKPRSGMTTAELVAEYRTTTPPQPATDIGSLTAAIHDFEAALPGWWWSVCVCSLTRDASCGPDIAGPDFDLLSVPKFDEGFHCDDPDGSLASSLRTVMAAALAAKADPNPATDQGRTAREVPGAPRDGLAPATRSVRRWDEDRGAYVYVDLPWNPLEHGLSLLRSAGAGNGAVSLGVAECAALASEIGRLRSEEEFHDTPAWQANERLNAQVDKLAQHGDRLRRALSAVTDHLCELEGGGDGLQCVQEARRLLAEGSGVSGVP